MPKADFEFYEIDGVDTAFLMPDEFVVPKEANDPYHGAFDISTAPTAITGLTITMIQHATGCSPKAAVSENRGVDAGGYFFDKIPYDARKVSRKLDIEVDLDESDDGFYSERMNDLAHLVTCRSAMLEVLGELDLSEEEDSLRRHVDIVHESAGAFVNTALIDDDERPVHPRIVYRQITPLRAFQWLPGPPRRSKERGMLPPTYSPRPVSVVFADLVEVTGLNPRVVPEETATPLAN